MSSRTGPLCNGSLSSFAFIPIVDFLNENGKAELEQLLDKHLPEAKDQTSQAERSHYKFIRSVLDGPEAASASLFMAPVFTTLNNEHVGRGPKGPPGSYASLCASLLHPFSTGSVHTSSADPTQKPVVDPRYFGHPLDVEIFARHVQYLERIAETEPLKSFLKPEGRCNTASNQDLQAAKDWLRASAISNWHPTSTCAMKAKDLGGVVNERLLVHGTSKLRVVDASVMPVIPRGNPISSVQAVAERAADLVEYLMRKMSETSWSY